MASKTRTVDDIITEVTEAATSEDALAILATVPRRMLLVLADQLYIENVPARTSSLRVAIADEARA